VRSSSSPSSRWDDLPDRGVQAAAMMAIVLWAALVALFLAFTLLCIAMAIA